MKRRHVPIARALTIFHLLVGLLLLGGSTLLLYTWINQTIYGMQEDLSRHQLDEVEQVIDTFLTHRQILLKDYASFPHITQGVMQPEDSLANLVDFMADLSLLGEQHQLILLDYRGRTIHATRNSPRFDYRAETWLTSLIAGESSQFLGVSHLDGKSYWRIAVPVLYRGASEGVLIAEIPIMAIEKELQIDSTLQGGQLELVQHERTLAAFGPKVAGVTEDYALNSPAILLRFHWDRQALDESRNSLLMQVAGSLVLMTLVLLLLAQWLGRRFLVRPLEQFRTLTHAIATDSEPPVAPLEQPISELAFLAADFYQMSSQIHLREQALMQARNQLEGRVAERTAELETELTERQRTEKLLVKASRDADAANRAKSEFLANMSHEIRTPLNAVIGFSELLTSLVTEAKQRSYLDSIQTAGKSLLQLINDILDLSKIEAGAMEMRYTVIDLKVLCLELQQIFQVRMATKGLQFILDYDDNLPPGLLLDEVRVRQVLFNLLGNAVKFTERGEVKLLVEQVEAGDEGSSIDLHISVEDSGIGIPADQQQSIFESFKQQDGQSIRKFGGTGLGLSITKRLVEMMEGSIEVRSEVGTGSCFEVFLRRVELVSMPQTDREAESDSDLRGICFSGGKILVVDDILSNRKLLKEVLKKLGFEVIEAPDGEQGLVLARSSSPELILMDIRMPGLDGYQATRLLREHPRTMNIPVIAQTASLGTLDHKNFEEQGFDGVLFKPIHPRKLLKELDRYFQRSSGSASGEVKQESVAQDDEISVELGQILAELLLPEWQSLGKVLDMEQIETFAGKLADLGKSHQSQRLVDYADRLDRAAQSFDITKLEQIIPEFQLVAGGLSSLASGQTTSPRPLRPLRILLADDVACNLKLIEAYLKQSEHQLEMVEDGRQVVERITGGGNYDLVLMDIEMPELDGYQATARIRSWEQQSQGSPLPIVAITADDILERDGQKILQAGFTDCLTKPLSKQQLFDLIDRLS